MASTENYELLLGKINTFIRKYYFNNFLRGLIFLGAGLFTAYVVITLSEYFGNFTETRRRKVWGATFQTQDRTKNLVSEVPGEYDALTKRLTEELPDRLHEEPDAISRIAIFGFPAQFAALRPRVTEFLNRIFEPTRYQANANLRGFYLSSGTQEGTPIDRLTGALSRTFGLDPRRPAAVMQQQGRSYFLGRLLRDVIFNEARLVGANRGRERRNGLQTPGRRAGQDVPHARETEMRAQPLRLPVPFLGQGSEVVVLLPGLPVRRLGVTHEVDGLIEGHRGLEHVTIRGVGQLFVRSFGGEPPGLVDLVRRHPLLLLERSHHAEPHPFGTGVPVEVANLGEPRTDGATPPRLLRHFTQRRRGVVLPVIELALGDRPIVLAGSMDQQDLPVST